MIYKLGHDREITELTVNFIEGLYNEYVPDNSLIVFDSMEYDIAVPDYITQVIFDAATNPIDIERYLTNISLDKFYIITGLYSWYKNHSGNPRIKFFPFWAIWSSSPHTGIIDTKNHKFQDQPKKYKVSCLNGTNWNHRKLTYIELAKKQYFNEIVFSFKNQRQIEDRSSDLKLTAEETDQFSSLPAGVGFIHGDGSGIDLSLNHPAYTETYVNLVTETNINAATPMLSEKSFKPIIAGQLFVLIAAPGAVQFLRDIGIDTFDDIIDHGYDQIIDPRSRIRSAIEQIDQLMTMNLAEVYQQLIPRLIRNSRYLKSSEFRQQFPLTFD